LWVPKGETILWAPDRPGYTRKGLKKMVSFSSDVDILKYEPVLFGELHLSGQVLAAGTGQAELYICILQMVRWMGRMR
jgi:hypothetical protein